MSILVSYSRVDEPRFQLFEVLGTDTPDSGVALRAEAFYETETADPCITEIIEGVPLSLLQAYADLAKRHAVTKQYNDGSWIARIEGFQGAYGEGESPDAAIADLREVVIDWVVVKRRTGDSDIPTMEGLDLNPTVRSGGGESPQTDEAE